MKRGVLTRATERIKRDRWLKAGKTNRWSVDGWCGSTAAKAATAGYREMNEQTPRTGGNGRESDYAWFIRKLYSEARP
jgi:hypothetical protein